MPASDRTEPPGVPAVLGPFGPVSVRRLWHLVNAPRHIDGAAVRVACLTLLTFYTISSIIRQVPAHPGVWGLRAAVILYAAGGALLGPHFSWRALRAYTLGLALLLPAITVTVAIIRGNLAADLAVTALAIFAPLVFLQTAVDIIVAVLALAVAAAALLAAAPPSGMPVDIAGVVLGGALLSGAVTGLVLIAFRGRIGESTAWWQQACGRERVLREFIAQAAPHLGEEVQARELAARLHGAFGPGHCAIILVEPGGAPRLAATAGAAPADTATPVQLTRLIAAVGQRQPLLCSPLTAETLRDELADLPWLAAGGTVVVLPVVIDERLGGAIVLSTPQPRVVAGEDLLLWRAMANQVGTAIGSARLFARLQEALRARSEFVNTMSHELRSPLHVIIGYAEMVKETRGEAAIPAERIRASALELLYLVENTLAAARLGSGRMRLEPTEFDLPGLVDELREGIRAVPEAKGAVPVHWEVEREMPSLLLDRLKLKEIVHNLVSNALKFTERGTVTVRFLRDGAQLRIEVEDTGRGIPPAARERMFDMFERLEPAGGPRAAGVGLGLYIVKSLVQLMQGTVTLESELGKGSRVTVCLPLRLGG